MGFLWEPAPAPLRGLRPVTILRHTAQSACSGSPAVLGFFCILTYGPGDSVALTHLFARPTLAQLRDRAAAQTGFRRILGTVELSILGIGLVVGTGIFVLTGHIAAHHAGPAVWLSFLLAAVPATLAALCYAEMVSLVPASGGAYTYVSVAMGEFAGFLMGWDLTLEYLVGTATVGIGWSGYAVAFCNHLLGHSLDARFLAPPVAFDPVAQRWALSGAYINAPALLVVLVMTAVVVCGLQHSMRVTAALVGVKLCTIFLFIVAAAPYIRRDCLLPLVPVNQGAFGSFGWSGVWQGASLAMFAYLGVDNLSTAVQEARDAQRGVPRAIAATLVLCTALYVAVCVVLVGVVCYADLGVADPLAVGIAATHRPWLSTCIHVGSLCGLTSVLAMQLYGLPRILYAMGRDALLPKFCTALHPRFGTPHRSTLAMGLVCGTAAALIPIEVVGELTSAGTLLAFIFVSLSVTVTRHLYPREPRAFRVPGGAYALPALSALSSLGLLLMSRPGTLWRLGIWLGVGSGVYYFMPRRRHSQPQP
jgi:APA family basic amino acid/polyamine antiporter